MPPKFKIRGQKLSLWCSLVTFDPQCYYESYYVKINVDMMQKV